MGNNLMDRPAGALVGGQQAPVFSAVSQVQAAIDRVCARALDLRARLEPVLEREPQPIKGNAPDVLQRAGGICDLQDALLEAHRRLDQLDIDLENALRRLAI